MSESNSRDGKSSDYIIFRLGAGLLSGAVVSRYQIISRLRVFMVPGHTQSSGGPEFSWEGTSLTQSHRVKFRREVTDWCPGGESWQS